VVAANETEHPHGMKAMVLSLNQIFKRIILIKLYLSNKKRYQQNEDFRFESIHFSYAGLLK